ncbi:MAG: hypothetical protein KDD48_08870 [Bdellovibrionales bacterium]|nr:hypothetical protein [Bdellovibrionales bacterium]
MRTHCKLLILFENGISLDLRPGKKISKKSIYDGNKYHFSIDYLPISKEFYMNAKTNRFR